MGTLRKTVINSFTPTIKPHITVVEIRAIETLSHRINTTMVTIEVGKTIRHTTTQDGIIPLTTTTIRAMDRGVHQ